ncbi:MAG: hypothetical protein ACYDB7_06255 [Mycobacteriales bacterium]
MGRVAWTAGVLAPPAFLYWANGPSGLLYCMSWLILGVPFLLRAVWARGRVS